MRIAAVVLGLSLVLCHFAEAKYTGLSVTSVDTTVNLHPFFGRANIPVTVHRVWANFTSGDDTLRSWGASLNHGSAFIYNSGLRGIGPGSGFLNHVYGSALPPASSAIVSNADSFFTLGITLQNQIPPGLGIVLFSPYNGDLTGTAIVLPDIAGGGVSSPPVTSIGTPNPITMAGFVGDGDPFLRVLLMQLVTRQGETVHGSVGLHIGTADLHAPTTFLQNQPFTSIVGQ